jgi:hypothetical protein
VRGLPTLCATKAGQRRCRHNFSGSRALSSSHGYLGSDVPMVCVPARPRRRTCLSSGRSSGLSAGDPSPTPITSTTRRSRSDQRTSVNHTRRAQWRILVTPHSPGGKVATMSVPSTEARTNATEVTFTDLSPFVCVTNPDPADHGVKPRGDGRVDHGARGAGRGGCEYTSANGVKKGKRIQKNDTPLLTLDACVGGGGADALQGGVELAQGLHLRPGGG